MQTRMYQHRSKCSSAKAFLLLLFALLVLSMTAQDEVTVFKIYNQPQDSLAARIVVADSLEDDTAGVADALPLRVLPDSALTDSARMAQAEALARWRQDVRQFMNERVRDELFETIQVGVMVWDLTDDRQLFAYNERQRMRPASTQKVVTAISVLDQLGAAYQFSTNLYWMGEHADSSRTLQGRLYLVGGMDPYLDDRDIAAFADSVKAMGVDTITGGIYSDYSFRDKKPMGEGWCWDDDDSNPNLSPLTLRGGGSPSSRLRTALRNRGIVMQGGSLDGECPRDAHLLCVRRRAVATVMRPMLKNSNNKCAESVFYQLAHNEGGRGASAKSGARAVARTLRRAGLTAERYNVADGSGLSLYNYVSAEMEVKLLRYAYQKAEIFEALYPLLPVAGRDGTLRKRMKGTRAQGNVHAKTGTVTGVRSLAGYCTAANGHVLAFALINQGMGDGGPARRWQDRVCEMLCGD